MKFLYFVLAVTFPTLIVAQHDHKFYNKIDKVGKIEATDSEINIKKADEVLIKIFISSKSKLFLDGYKQVKDSTGIYMSYFHFINNDEISCEFNLMFQFNKPVIEGELKMPKGTVDAILFAKNFNKDKSGYQYRGVSPCEKGLLAVFKSSEPVTVSITGIEGIK